MNKAPMLKKDNIILRQVTSDDIIARTKLGLNREFVMMTGGNINKFTKFTHDDSIVWYENIINHPCKWIIEYNGKLVGVVSLRPFKENNKAKLAIELYDDHIYGKGIGTQVVKMVIKYAFEEVEYHKVYLRVLEYNKRAIKCYENCGFIKEGIDREGSFINGRFCSDIYMGILKKEYKS